MVTDWLLSLSNALNAARGSRAVSGSTAMRAGHGANGVVTLDNQGDLALGSDVIIVGLGSRLCGDQPLTAHFRLFEGIEDGGVFIQQDGENLWADIFRYLSFHRF